MMIDSLIVGGGPAGLTAALYLARFHLSVRIIDAGDSRAALIPLSRNHAGFPDGISGIDLLARMRRQVEHYGGQLEDGIVVSLTPVSSGFIIDLGDHTLTARTVLLATGVVNRRPEMLDPISHDRALAQGLLRYCPICDGFEVTDASIAVLGTSERGCAEALFLRSYSADVTLVAPTGGHSLSPEQRAILDNAGIIIGGTCTAIRIDQGRMIITIDDQACVFDTLYPALGSTIRSELAGALGASRTQDACIKVDAHQRTNVPGLYAAGDVVLGLDQISHAMGEGGVAATTIRNDLAAAAPLLR